MSTNFAEYVLTDEKLEKLLEKQDFERFMKIKEQQKKMDFDLASKIASAIKNWSLSLGATHYTHWFFPLTNKSAEKQMSFLDMDSRGRTIEKFDASCLIKGETDASSFPSGNERETFEARGYTIWNYTSPVFIKQNNGSKVLYIPTAFCSYTGVALDEKTPLLRALDSLNEHLTPLLKTLKMKNVKRTFLSVGLEQEYFLLDEKLFLRRSDLALTGRSLLSGAPSKSQEVSHHYFCSISSRVQAFMHDLDSRLRGLGVLAKTQHTEVAPSQFEIVPLHAPANIAADQNMLLMETMEMVAKEHGFKVLFHEKPFFGVNGSGKHNNWSLFTDTGVNLLDKKMVSRDVFMLIFTCILAALAKHYELLRICTSTHSNDLRLGSNEAPPPTFSVYIGDGMKCEIENYISGSADIFSKQKLLDAKSSSVVNFLKDECDRNRTSPFAYTGNKFEFRSLGSSQNPSLCNAIICMIIAKEFKEANNALSHSTNIKRDIKKLVKKNYTAAQKIIFNGNNYSREWQEEAKRRGIKTHACGLDCYHQLLIKKNVGLFEEMRVMSKTELCVRRDALVRSYVGGIILEAKVIKNMTLSQVVPALIKYENEVLQLEKSQSELGLGRGETSHLSRRLNSSLAELLEAARQLEKCLERIGNKKQTMIARRQLLPLCDRIQKTYRQCEPHIKSTLPFPTADELLFFE